MLWSARDGRERRKYAPAPEGVKVSEGMDLALPENLDRIVSINRTNRVLSFKRKRWIVRTLRLFGAVLAVLTLTAGECSENPVEEGLAGEDDVLIRVTKHNLDTENIHIFARNEDFPCCQVAPGDQDATSTVLASEGEEVAFSAGRNGNRFASVNCTVTDEALDAGAATVEFRLDQSLRCVDW